MGIIYGGPYTEDVNRDGPHEGYAARLMPDGTLTGTWGGEHGWTGHSGLVGACDCGWRSSRTWPPGDYDSPEYEAARQDFLTQHLDQLVEQARRESWPRWVASVTAYATYIADLAAQGRLDDADDQLDALRDEVASRRRVTAELRADLEFRQARELDSRPAASGFAPLTDTPAAATTLGGASGPHPPAPATGPIRSTHR